MSDRRRAALAGAVIGVLLVVLVVALVRPPGGGKAAVSSAGQALSARDQNRVFAGRIQLSNYCTQAIERARRETTTAPIPATRARQTVAELVRLARAKPRGYATEIGPMKTVLTGAARDLENPACLPDEAARLRAEASRLPG